MTRVVLAPRARSDLADLDWRLANAVQEAIGILELEPDAGKPLRGRLTGVWSLRIGAYRILYQKVDAGRTVRIASIRHRAVAYRSDPR